MTKSFNHLHVHTTNSILDGASKHDELAEAAAKDGQAALAITDHGNMSGVVSFYDACKKNGVNPVIGEELYMAYNSVDDRPKKKNNKEDDSGGETDEGRKLYFHLIALAENNTGYKNLIQLSSRAFLEGYYYKPRVDWDMLSDHSEGIIATSGCLGGQVLQHFLRGEDKLAYEKAARLQDIFGRDNFFIELQDHGIADQITTNPKLIKMAKTIGAPLLATNDSHYTKKEDQTAHDALLCCQTSSQISDKDRFRFEGDQHYLKTAAEMRTLFSDHPEALDNSLLIGERANVVLAYDDPTQERYHLPEFPVPEGFSGPAEYLRHLTLEGIKERLPNYTDEYIDRIMYELKVIEDMNFSSYFLITWDLVKYAKSRDIIVGPGRGSAGGSAVAFALRITDLDPIKYDLLFERFLNPSRISMPDIDMDFDSRYRDEMIQYTKDKYGEDHVVQIITFSQIKARGSVRDAARVLGYPFSLGDRVAKAMPPLIAGRDTPLWACLEQTDKFSAGYDMAYDLRKMIKTEPDVREVVEIALGLEGQLKSDGQHAAAVIITPNPVHEYLPTQQKPNKPRTSQYEMDYVEKLGLLKMDYLAVKNLDTIADAIAMIKKNHGVEIDRLEIPLDDEKTYKLLSDGLGIGLFQLESPQMRSLMRALEPDTFDDVAALIALYRPGPMAANMHIDYADRKNGRKPVEYLHPDAEEVLGDTYGLMIYQEELMRIAQRFAGFTLAEADNLRKGVGKKIPEVVAKARNGFVEGCVTNGYTEKLGNDWFDIIEPFADYGFNKCISGDTILEKAGANDVSGSTITVEELYKKANPTMLAATKGRPKSPYVGPCVNCGADESFVWKRGICNACYAMHQKITSGRFNLLAYESASDRIKPAKVKAVYCNGVKPVYKLILQNGQFLKSTGNHRHLTSEGYKQTDQLNYGDLLVVNSGLDAESGMSLDDLRTTSGERSAVGSIFGACGPDNYGYIDGGFISFRQNSKKLPDHCQHCQENEGRLEVAHLDGNRRNNEISNLAKLCVSCHKKHDYENNNRRRRFEKGYATAHIPVIAVEYVGEEMTYDVEMDSVDHNFVANGIVTHNSHSYGYGLVSYWTAYLKANYPAEYMAALLTTSDSKTKVPVYLNEAAHMGLTVIAPDVNLSQEAFTVTQLKGQTVIPFGLESIAHVGKLSYEIITERDTNGPFKSIHDFCTRVDAKILNKTNLNALVRAGAFDSVHPSRNGVLEIAQDTLEAARKARKKNSKDALQLFDVSEIDDSIVPDIPTTREDILNYEKELLGLYVTYHPLDGYEKKLREVATTDIGELDECSDKSAQRLVGVITKITRKRTRKGDPMVILTVEDFSGECEAVLFKNTLERYSEFVDNENVLVFDGKVNKREEYVSLVVDDIEELDAMTSEPVIIFMEESLLDEMMIERLQALFYTYPGDSPVILDTGDKTVNLNVNVSRDKGLFDNLKVLVT